jgi:peroxiredoxin Q/BCP
MAKTTQEADSPYPKVGTKAPAFTAESSLGKKVKLSDLKGKIVVLYFYPKDDTPGCTKQACSLRDNHGKLQKAGIEVLGVSPDSVASHGKFIDKYELPFTLLADEDQSICSKYGVWQEKSMYGKKFMGVARTTFIIDPDGKIAHVMPKVKPDNHADDVLEWINANLKE